VQSIPSSPQGLRVLVVDDSQDVTEMVGVMLQHLGYEFERAHSGAEALTVFDPSRHGVVLLDLGLPDVDGCAVAEQMHARSPSTMLVALTGYGDDFTMAAVERSGFNERLIKPLRWPVLEALLARAAQPVPLPGAPIPTVARRDVD
jgi:CheY-like chemotaxis protein